MKNEVLENAAAAVKLLTTAREYITPRERWIKGRLHSGEKSCALGAIDRAKYTTGIGRDHKAAHQAVRALSKVMGGHIPGFNDHPRTKHEDVLAAFDGAIEDQCAIVRANATPCFEEDEQ